MGHSCRAAVFVLMALCTLTGCLTTPKRWLSDQESMQFSTEFWPMYEKKWGELIEHPDADDDYDKLDFSGPRKIVFTKQSPSFRWAVPGSGYSHTGTIAYRTTEFTYPDGRVETRFMVNVLRDIGSEQREFDLEAWKGPYDDPEEYGEISVQVTMSPKRAFETGAIEGTYQLLDDLDAKKLFGHEFAKSFFVMRVHIANTFAFPVRVDAASIELQVFYATEHTKSLLDLRRECRVEAFAAADAAIAIATTDAEAALAAADAANAAATAARAAANAADAAARVARQVSNADVARAGELAVAAADAADAADAAVDVSREAIAQADATSAAADVAQEAAALAGAGAAAVDASVDASANAARAAAVARRTATDARAARTVAEAVARAAGAAADNADLVAADAATAEVAAAAADAAAFAGAAAASAAVATANASIATAAAGTAARAGADPKCQISTLEKSVLVTLTPGRSFMVWTGPRVPMNFTQVVNTVHYNQRNDWRQLAVDIATSTGTLAASAAGFGGVGASYPIIVSYATGVGIPVLSKLLLQDLVENLAFLNATALHDSVTVAANGVEDKFVFFPRGDLRGVWGLEQAARIMYIEEVNLTLSGSLVVQEQSIEAAAVE